ncbi:catalase family peroxidase [Roseomonas sp. M0104]|uniref:Catalase-related peroxidase n=2 Tax=Teichococcus coralli TaxID=2545983 RepID=A0A845BFZ8_9PROT|nr:catalase family peroxidase [Pseudoroseomonas coralli]
MAGIARAQPGRSGVPAGIVGAFDNLFQGPHPARRAVHATGLLCTGSFHPHPEAPRLSRAPHLAGEAVPVLVRFSNFAAAPGLPDGDPAASPRGMAIKFLLPGEQETDIVAHSYDGFPAATPEAFLAFLRAVPDPAALQGLAAASPAVRAFLDDPKPAPASYATEAYFGVNAFRFSNAAGEARFGRYRILPQAGPQHLTPGQAAARPADYLTTELRGRLSQGKAGFRLLVQLAEPGDDTQDGSRAWPAERPLVELGTLSLEALAAPADAARQDLRFVPTSLVAGIAPSGDPMLLARTQAYQISAERRAAQ